MNQTPPELLAPYKAALVAAGRDAMRAIRETGAAGARYEIPGTVPPALVVVGDEAEVARLLRAPAREPMLGGRRAGDVPAPPLTWDEPGAGPRGWTLLLAADGSGVAGKQGSTFEQAAQHLERVDVVEAEPVLEQLGELQRENAELRAQVAATAAARDVLAERYRQVEQEGWSQERDDQYSHRQLPRAAAVYAVPELKALNTLQVWPWADSWWKPADERRNLVKAGALIIAEIERLDRAGQQVRAPKEAPPCAS